MHAERRFTWYGFMEAEFADVPKTGCADKRFLRFLSASASVAPFLTIPVLLPSCARKIGKLSPCISLMAFVPTFFRAGGEDVENSCEMAVHSSARSCSKRDKDELSELMSIGNLGVGGHRGTLLIVSLDRDLMRSRVWKGDPNI